MKNSYTEERGAFDTRWDDDDPDDPDSWFDYVQDGTPFHVGQSYVDIPVPKLVCAKCGGDKFLVGSAEYSTAIKCPTCLWEHVIHDG
jgi:hypothetical protein